MTVFVCRRGGVSRRGTNLNTSRCVLCRDWTGWLGCSLFVCLECRAGEPAERVAWADRQLERAGMWTGWRAAS